MKHVLLLFILFLLTQNKETKAQTWSDDVACIIYTHCTSCHNPNGIAPFSLTTYASAALWANGIKSSVNAGSMPPWPPDSDYKELAHERLLSQTEKDIITAWVDNNVPLGNTSNAPVTPVYNNIAQISSPDISAVMSTYTVPNITNDLYRSFIITPPIAGTNNFISGFEVLPGNRSIVHHVLVFQDTSNTPVLNDSADPGPGYTSYGGIGSNTADLVGAWVPGSNAIFYPNTMGVKLKPNARIIIQIHYPADASLQSDSTRVNIKFDPTATRQISIEPVLGPFNMINGPLSIPANTVKTFDQNYTLSSLANVSVIGISPHAHLLCTSMKSFAVSATNDTTEMINIPEWDFHWQGSYFFPKPIHLTPNTNLYGTATYDNTTNNPHNPNNPPQLVTWGEATTDEMMLFYYSYLVYQPGDENIIIDTSSHQAHYLNCKPTTALSNNELVKNNNIKIYPNPANAYLNILSDNLLDKVEVIDIYGKLIYSFFNKQNLAINIENLTKGNYFIKASRANSVSYYQFIKN